MMPKLPRAMLEPVAKEERSVTPEEFWALPSNEARAAAWEWMPQVQRNAARRLPTEHQLWDYRDQRVEVVTEAGETRRFWVSMSTGWQPTLLEVKTRRSLGGAPCDARYRSFAVISKAGPR